MNKKVIPKLIISLSMTAALAVFFIFFSQTKSYQILELKALDLRFSLKPGGPVLAPVVHIDIDDESLARLGRWPWPRSYHAALVNILNECQAKQILFDVLFMEETKDDPQQDKDFSAALASFQRAYLPFYFAENEFTYPKELLNLLKKDIGLTAEDIAKSMAVDPKAIRDKVQPAKKYVIAEALKEAFRRSPQISLDDLLTRIEDEYGWRLFPEDENYISDNYDAARLSGHFVNKFSVAYPIENWQFSLSYPNIIVPIRQFTDTIKSSGFINADADLDGVTRQVPLFIRHEDKLLAQLTVAALLDSLGVTKVQTRPDQVILKNAKTDKGIKDIVIPVNKQGMMLINWQGRWGVSFKHLPFHRIMGFKEIKDQLKNAPDRAIASPEDIRTAEYLQKSHDLLKEKLTAMVKDKICIVGLTATGTHDLRPIPLQANFPMVGVHSNVINTILTGNFIVRKQGLINIFIFLACALVIAFGSLIKLWKSLLVSFCFSVGYFLLSLWLFNQFGWWVDLVGPLGIVVFGFSAVTSFRYFTEEKEKLWIKQAFSHYLSKEVINELMDDPSKLKLGGERRSISVFFSDVRGFTTFSESHQPEEVVAMLNEILTEQVKVVFKYSGTLDKFVGDELMAFFGAPGNRHLKDHALIAVRTAVEIQAKMKELQASWIQAKKDPLYIGIGINTGDMVVGNMGSAERMDYTVIGDNVNLGARLCSAAAKGEIIISQFTYDFVANEVKVDKLEPIMVKGKAKPISIYRVIGLMP